MKKLAMLCVGLMLLSATLGVAGVARAQGGAASGPFADVPTDHWAYQAVDTLQKAGIVIGYPDGTYGGRRAMTRYEFAVAIARLLPLINSNAASKSDLSALQQEMEDKLQQNQAAIDALKALVDEFQPELEALGQDVAAIKARLDALEARVAAVEAEQRRVKITGDVNFIARGLVNSSTTEAAPLDQDGYRAGAAGKNTTSPSVVSPHSSFFFGGDATSGDPNGNTSLWNDVNFYNDVLLTIDGRVSDNAHAIVKVEGGDYAPYLTSLTTIEDERLNGVDTASNNGTWLNIYEAYLDMPVSLGGLSGAEAIVGRFGNQFTPYTMKAVNPDSYASLPETSSGDYPMDGAKLIFSAGPAHVQLYAAKNDLSGDWVEMNAGPQIDAGSGAYRPGSLQPGGMNYNGSSFFSGSSEYVVDQSAGGRVTFGNPSNWVLGLTGILARVSQFGFTGAPGEDPYKDTHGTGANDLYNTLGIYGVDFSGMLPFLKTSGLTLSGEADECQTGIGSHFGNINSSHDNQAWNANLGWATGPFSIKGGYQTVYMDYAAPGDWGHVGTWINPVNVKGPVASASYVVTPKLTLAADGAWYQGAQSLIAPQSPLTNNGDKLNHYKVGLKYGLTSQYSVDLGYEYDQWQLDDRFHYLIKKGNPTEQYITLGVGHSFNKNASIKVLYQILQYNDNGTGFDPLSEGRGLNGKENGGVAETQFAVKF